MFPNFCRCNAAVSVLYDGKSKNKIDIVFFLIPMVVIIPSTPLLFFKSYLPENANFSKRI